MQNHKTIKSFTCIRCLEAKDCMSDKDTNPLFLCSACDWHDRTAKTIVVELEGAPAGYVRNSRTRCKNTNRPIAFKG